MDKKDKIPIFVISLTKDVHRRELIRSAFERYGIHEFSFFEACDGYALTEDQIQQYYSEELAITYERALSKGEIGCAMSYINICQMMLRDNISQALILEDDAVFDERLTLAMDSVLSFPDDWEIVHLHNNGDRYKRKYTLCAKEKRNDLPFFLGKPFLLSITYFSHAFFINKRGVEKLLNMMSPFVIPIDHYLGDSRRFSIYCFYPDLSIQNTALSSHIERDREYSISQRHLTVNKKKFILEYVRHTIRNVLRFFRIYFLVRIVWWYIYDFVIFKFLKK